MGIEFRSLLLFCYLAFLVLNIQKMDGLKIVTDMQEAGFDKVCVINSSYQVTGASAADAVPAAYKDDGTDVNENQELANDWTKISKFRFFKTKVQVVNKGADFLVGKKNADCIVAKKVNIDGAHAGWIVAYTTVKGMGAKKDAVGKFGSAANAYNKACSAVFDDLDE